jgi:hypothetical protein
MAWARDALARAKLTQRDLARVWSTAESSVSRWLDGFQGDLSVARAMQFANLVKMPCCQMSSARSSARSRRRTRRRSRPCT